MGDNPKDTQKIWNDTWRKGDLALKFYEGGMDTPMKTIEGNATVGFHTQYIENTKLEPAESQGLSGKIRTLQAIARPNYGYKKNYANETVSADWNTSGETYSDVFGVPLSAVPVGKGAVTFKEVQKGATYFRLRKKK